MNRNTLLQLMAFELDDELDEHQRPQFEQGLVEHPDLAEEWILLVQLESLLLARTEIEQPSNFVNNVMAKLDSDQDRHSLFS